jgi:ABC-type sugar transport system substrate-binding protein
MARTTHNRRRGLTAISVLASLALVVAACGGDDDEGGGAGDATTAAAADSAAPAATTAAGDSTATTAASGDGGASGFNDLAGAQAIVAQYLQAPADIPVTTPIEGEIPTGKTVYFIGCGTEYCSLETDILQQAVDILGWKLEAFETDGTPESTTQAWTQAVNDKVDYVIYSATPRSQIGDLMEQAAANGTQIVACCTVDPTDDVLDFVIGSAEQTGELGEIMAAWVINDAAEQGLAEPGVLYVDLPDFPILTALGQLFESGIAGYCPNCTFEKLDLGLADLGDAADQIVSTLRANPDLKYLVFSTDSPFVGVPAALAAAGMNDIRSFGEGPTSAVLQNIVAGDQAGSMAFAIYENFFTLVDALVRLELGLPMEDAAPPNQILNADNIQDTTSLTPLLPDTVERFTELWGK